MDLEPGQSAVAHFCRLMRRQGDDSGVQSDDDDRTEPISANLLPPGHELVFESMFKSKQRLTLKRGPLLGSGGLGIVYSMTQVDGTKVAVKIVGRSIGGQGASAIAEAGEELLEIVDREASVSATLGFQDPAALLTEARLLAAHDILRLPGNKQVFNFGNLFLFCNRFLVFPEAAGTLEDLIGVLDDSEMALHARLSATSQMINVIANLHSKRMIHGDIKPTNFFLSDNGIVLLGDFSYPLTDGDVAALVVVTPSMLSPEVVRFVKEGSAVRVDRTLDSWMLGLTLYILWCGRLPWGLSLQEEDYDKIMGLHRQSRPATLSFNDCNGIIPQIQVLILHFLSKDPKDRWTPRRAVVELDIYPVSETQSAAQA
ncbi:rhoptry kinase family protein ROP31 [Besnoitia besnoiti]|uniref:Rhoptry kinase family protein ROP31 n=1 Tax=Besnoitia besnoiti TaxID=94643 RepID=A0A2A9MPD1_BESBE|nr:rhoptry kinase family protein ROP31 [Besnoitia besnoiti]PFH37903.1 rhoptry kinase family protein ROP31 [Besnoitia besnoiti]